MESVLHQIIYFGSQLSFIFCLFLILLTVKKWQKIRGKKLYLGILIFFYILTISFIYARYIEPNILITKNTKIETGFSAKVVVLADIHIGDYTKTEFLERIVEKVNKIEDVDFILMPGDFTYYPEENLEELFLPLKDLKYPVYGVLGNHDSEKPGPKIQEELEKALEKNGVIFLHNESIKVEKKDIEILGLGDRWAYQDDVGLIESFTEDSNLIVITHNPDTVMDYETNVADLTVSGHTHGGQIRLPFIYKSVIPSEYGFDEGFYEVENGKVYVSAGLGTVGLPMRLFIPPRIDVLELY